MSFYIFFLLLSASVLSACAATEEVNKDAPTQTQADTNAIPKEWVASTYVERHYGHDMSKYHAKSNDEKESIKREPYEIASQAINEETKKLWEAVQKSTKRFGEVRHVFESLKDVTEGRDTNKPNFDDFVKRATEKKQQVTVLVTEAEEKWNAIKQTAENEKTKSQEFDEFLKSVAERKTKAETLNGTITQEITNMKEKVKHFSTTLATCPQEEENHKKVKEEVTAIVKKAMEASSQMPSVTEGEKKKQETYGKLNEEAAKAVQTIQTLIAEMDELVKRDKAEATKKTSQQPKEGEKLPSDNTKPKSDSAHINKYSLFSIFVSLLLIAVMRA